MKVRLVKFYNSCSQETTCNLLRCNKRGCPADKSSVTAEEFEKAVSIKLNIPVLWLRKKGIKWPVRIILSTILALTDVGGKVASCLSPVHDHKKMEGSILSRE